LGKERQREKGKEDGEKWKGKVEVALPPPNQCAKSVSVHIMRFRTLPEPDYAGL